MSNEIPLQVFYSKLDNPSKHSEAYAQAVSLEEISKEEAPKRRIRNLHPCARLCMCLWFTFVITSLVLTLIGTIHFYYSYQGCFESEHFEMEKLITELDNIDQISFDLVTAGIEFGTHDGDKLIVNFYHSAREKYLLEEMVGGMSIIDRVLYINDVTPSFDYNTCQYTYIEVLFPSDVSVQTSDKAISIIGTVQVGYVATGFLSNVGDINVDVKVGFVDLEVLNAKSVVANTGLGLIFAESVWSAESVVLNVNTGSVRTQSIVSPLFEANAVYGTSWNVDIQADFAMAHTNYGYATLLRPTHFSANTNQVVSVDVHYGRALASYDQFYNVEFNLQSGIGHVDMSYDDDCELADTTSTSLLGTCSFEAMEPTTTVTVSVTYGVGRFIQTEPDFDSLELSVDSPQYEIDEDDQE